MVCAALAVLPDGPSTIVLVTAHLDQADDAAEDAELFLNHPVNLLPAWASEPDYSDAADEIAAERIRLCRQLADARFGKSAPGSKLASSQQLIVAPVQALMQPAPDPELLEKASLPISVGSEMSIDSLAAWLADHGFARVEIVDVPGDFAVRGGIVDVFPAGAARDGAQPVRIDFFGDQVESIRLFDLDTQRSHQPIDAIELVGSVPAPLGTNGGRYVNFLDLLPDDALVVFQEPIEISELGNAYVQRSDSRESLYPVSRIISQESGRRQLMLARFASDASGGEPVVDFGCRSLQRFEVSPRDAVAELVRLADETDVTVLCERPGERERLKELLVEQHGQVPPRLTMRPGFLHAGFQFPAGDFLLVGHHEVFHRYGTRHRVRRVQAGRPIDSFLDLAPGEHVVHVTHGIARFRGIGQLERHGRTEEFLTLEFANKALLHVPVSQIQLVHKYVGAFRGQPKLSKLGGKAWSAKKDQVAKAVNDLAAELLATQARRQAEPGFAYRADSELQKEFEDSFIYQETEDQILTLRQIKKDLESSRPMDRLLCGDVGYGKTELAVRAAFKAVEGNRQVAVLVPTTVLAEQHERTFRERLADYPVTVESISRFRTGGQLRSILSRTAVGKVDVLIGTHRLLSPDVQFNDLGLVVIDEEQRFGVEHKERLKRLRATVDVLTMTATPIPRTLHMAMLGLRDISALATPPMDRRAIHTEVVPFNPEQIRAAVIRELNRDGQVYFVHNRVHSIRSVADRLAAIVPEARIIVGHGQMPGRELEKVMLRFVRRQADILVCTTIIESGVDIPNVNTIFIHEADQFGLAELHQLRGRVGRYKHKAFCYLLLPERRALSPTAGRRLKAIEEFSELGAGFRIAMRDLEIRGAGNILGPEQSGHIAAVGYELYCELLESSVRTLKGEAAESVAHATLELGVSGYLPRDYVPSDRQRLDAYRRLAQCRGERDIEQLENDLVDSYGPLPPAARDLLALGRLRLWAGLHAVRSMVAQPPDLVIDSSDIKRTAAVLGRAPGIVRVIDDHTVHLRLRPNYFEPQTLLAVLRKTLRPGGSR